MSLPQEVLTVLEVREYVSDYASNNYLIKGVEFSDTYISLCRDLALEAFNAISPMTSYTLATIPSKSVLLMGTVWKMLDGKAILQFRNKLPYADGGLQVELDSHGPEYMQAASNFQQQFQNSAQALKTNLNIESGWGCVDSDYSRFPLF